MRARVLAIIAAVVLVAGAVLIRSAITDDGDDQSCADGSAETCVDGGGGSDRPRVACTPDLDAVCDALAAEEAIERVEPFDLDDAVARAAGLDGWLTYGAAPTMVGYDVSDTDPRQGPYDLAPAPIASARLTAVVPPGSTDDVGDPCLQAPTWICLDEAVRTDRVPLAVGDTKPMSAAAITALAPLAEAGRRGDPDAFVPVAPAYEDALVDAENVAEQLSGLVTAPGLAYVVVAPAANAQDTVRQAERRGSETDLRALAAAPPAPAVVVLARTRTGDLGNDVEEALLDDGAPADALTALGYRIDPDADIPTLSEAGFLWQVREALD